MNSLSFSFPFGVLQSVQAYEILEPNYPIHNGLFTLATALIILDQNAKSELAALLSLFFILMV